jgi:hypothetical protein
VTARRWVTLFLIVRLSSLLDQITLQFPLDEPFPLRLSRQQYSKERITVYLGQLLIAAGVLDTDS